MWQVFRLSGFFTRLLAYCLLLVAIPSSLISVLFFQMFHQVTITNVYTLKSQNISLTARVLDIIVQQAVALVNVYNLDEEWQSHLVQEVPDPLQQLKYRVKVEAGMMLHTVAFDWVDLSIALSGVNGLTYSSDYSSTSVTMQNLREMPWYGELLQRRDEILWLPPSVPMKSQAQGHRYITAVKLLDQNLYKEPYGLMLLSIRENSLYRSYRHILSPDSVALVMDGIGQCLSSSAWDAPMEVDWWSQALQRGDAKGQYKVSLGGKAHLVTFHRLEKANWYILDCTPLDSLISTEQGTTIGWISLASILVGFGIAYAIARSISKPLLELCEKVVGYAPKGAMKLRPKNDEVSLLTTEYQNLLDRLDGAIQELLEAQWKKNKAELQVLQLQVNPHFFYNTLNGIKGMALSGSHGQIPEMIDALSNLLEHTLSRRGEMVPLRDELACVKSFITLHNIRVGSKIACRVTAEAALMECLVPSLLLQPIVENAILHGFGQLPHGCGSINIGAFGQNGDLYIEVVDNGSGISPEAMDRLQDKGKFNGIGLSNVDERIKLYYGPQYGLAIRSKQGIGTSVQLHISKLAPKGGDA